MNLREEARWLIVMRLSHGLNHLITFELKFEKFEELGHACRDGHAWGH